MHIGECPPTKLERYYGVFQMKTLALVFLSFLTSQASFAQNSKSILKANCTIGSSTENFIISYNAAYSDGSDANSTSPVLILTSNTFSGVAFLDAQGINDLAEKELIQRTFVRRGGQTWYLDTISKVAVYGGEDSGGSSVRYSLKCNFIKK